MKTKPKAIICDLDGTLALLNGRHPFDASTCDQDLLNEPVADIIRVYSNSFFGTRIIFCSGREERFREPTERFIGEHLPTTEYDLFMRPTGDYRKDSIIKKEILDRDILPNYEVLFVLDDRNQVVDMWRGEGLTCLQVAPGDF